MTTQQTPTGEISNEEANELADEILLRGEFLGSREPGFFSRSVDRVFGWIGDLIERIFSTIFGGAGAGAGVTIAYLLLGVAIIIVLIALVKAFRTRRADDGDVHEAAARIVFDEVVDPEELRADLASLRAAGNWRGAVVASFRLAIVALIEQGVAVERPGATTGDFGRALGTDLNWPTTTGRRRMPSIGPSTATRRSPRRIMTLRPRCSPGWIGSPHDGHRIDGPVQCDRVDRGGARRRARPARGLRGPG
jgi:uncharacterized membrane protein YuzA (DUF378 family)